MTTMAILQEVDKCVRCNGCVIACKRTWDLKLPTDIAKVKPARSLVAANQRLAIKSQRRGDMGPFVRFTCWHCPAPPCAAACPLGAISKLESGAVAVDNAKCLPGTCNPDGGPFPCQTGCQRGGYPKVGTAYEHAPAAGLGTLKMNKCTLCTGRAGSDAQITAAIAAVGGTGASQNPDNGLQTRAAKHATNDTYLSSIDGNYYAELKHEPACVSSCPAKAMKWDTRDNILAYLNANYVLNDGPGNTPGTHNWVGGGSLYWASHHLYTLAPPKADPFIEDHIAPMASSLISGGKMVLPTLIVGGLAALSARRTRIESDATTAEEV